MQKRETFFSTVFMAVCFVLICSTSPGFAQNKPNILVGAVRLPAHTQGLQPAKRSIRARRHGLQQLPHLVDPPCVPPGSGAGVRGSLHCDVPGLPAPPEACQVLCGRRDEEHAGRSYALTGMNMRPSLVSTPRPQLTTIENDDRNRTTSLPRPSPVNGSGFRSTPSSVVG